MADFVTEPGPRQTEAGIGYVGDNPVFGARDNLTASTTHSIAGGTPIDRNSCRFTTVANAGDAGTLPFGFPGLLITVSNAATLNNMQVYGAQAGDLLNGVLGSVGLSLMPGACCNFYCMSVNKSGNAVWTVQDVGVGNAGNYPTLAWQTALTAGVTQTAAGGTSITSSIAEFDTVAHTGDAATLPPAQPGMQITVINNGSNTLQVFSATQSLGGISGGDKINNSSTSINLASPPVITQFYCTVLGNWLTK